MTTPEPTTLREALAEAIHWVTTYDDTMGHGYYCATQSGEFGESCTCGYDEMMDRWRAALATPPAALLCPMCGGPVRVVSTDEGTNHYEPVR